MPIPCADLTAAAVTALHAIRAETWKTAGLLDLEATPDGLRLAQDLGFQPEAVLERPPWAEVAGLAACRCGLAFVLDSEGRLWTFDPRGSLVDRLPCLAPFSNPAGLAVSDRTIFVSEPGRVTALARSNGQIRWIWEEEGALPGDLAVDGRERLLILDKASGLVRVLDPGGRPHGTLGEGILVSPSRIALGLDGKLYALEAERIVRFDWPEGEGVAIIDLRPARAGSPRPIAPAAVTADGAGVMFVGDDHALTGEEERVITRFSPDGDLLEPLLGYLGPARHLTWGGGRLFVAGEQGRLTALSPAALYRQRGSFGPLLFDSGTEGTLWHKLVLQGDWPDGTQVRIQYQTAESPGNLSNEKWSQPLLNFPEALTDGPGGRFLALRGELTSNNPAVTPRLRSVAAVFPRSSLVRYLPGIYAQEGQRQDAMKPDGRRGFLDRFLGVFESLTARLDTLSDGTPRLIDPGAAPPEFLPWLSSWLALGIEEGWSEAQARQFIRLATKLYRDRGTREGISRIVELLTGEPPLIFEPFQLRCIQDPALRVEYERLFGSGECRFCLLIGPQAASRPNALSLVRRAVQAETPAHVVGGAQGLRPWFHLGFHTYLEINTRLTEPTLVLEKSILGGGETGLLDREPTGQVGRRARLDWDTVLT